MRKLDKYHPDRVTLENMLAVHGVAAVLDAIADALATRADEYNKHVYPRCRNVARRADLHAKAARAVRGAIRELCR